MEHKTFEQLKLGDKIYVMNSDGTIQKSTVTYIGIWENCGDLGISITPGLGKKVSFIELLMGLYNKKLSHNRVIATSKKLLQISEKEYRQQFRNRLWK